MRKSLIALPLLLVAVSCIGQFARETASEVSVEAFVTSVESKGYAEGPALEESGVARDIHVSAYNTTRRQPFFVDATFKKDGSFWKNYVGDVHRPIYWPESNRLDVMAYSAGESSPAAVWNPTNPASSLILDVTEESLNDDILYASAKDCSYAVARDYGEDRSNVKLKFNHAQARIDFEISSDDLNVAFLKGIILEGVHTSGLMKVEDRIGVPELTWDFGNSPKVRHTIFPEIVNSPIPGTSSTPLKYSILLPQQPRSSFKVLFILWKGEQTSERSYTVTLDPDETWYSGVRYTYRINVTSRDYVLTSSSAPDGIEARVSVEEDGWN